MIYELWYSKKENSYSFIPRNEHYEISLRQNKNFAADLEQVWTYDAKSHFEAMQAYHDHLGYGQYKPEPDWENTIYDEK